MHVREVFSRQAHQWGISVSPALLERLESYVRFLGNYEKANVIGTREPSALMLDHVLDSLSCFLFKPLWRARTLADVGSGGRLPGIPLAMASPALQATLIESTGKKAIFLRDAVRCLALDRVDIKNQRAEDVASEPRCRETFDIVTARAVASLSVLAEYCVPLVQEGGYVIAMKGAPSTDEMVEGERAAECLGARLEETISVPMLQEMRAKNRTLVILKKVRPTPEGYPRKAGTARHHPLGKD